MIVGVPKEIKNHEYRVAVVPAGVRALVASRHQVLVETSAGEGSGISDQEYVDAGAVITRLASEIYEKAELVVKVKEPLAQEYGLLREGQVLFTFLHLAPAPDLTRAMLRQKVIGIAYETVQLDDGSLPLLTLMSEIAGKMSVQIGCHYLEKQNGGSGVLLGGIPGTGPGSVAIIGGGSVGTNAARIALGMGASVTILDTNLERLRYLSDVLQGRIVCLVSNSVNIERAVARADLVVGAVLIPGAKAPRLVTRAMIADMRPGSVVVDVSIDQGGCVEGAVPTTFDQPTFTVDGVTFCCLANMPSAVARTSTFALANATIQYTLKLANSGYEEAVSSDRALRRGVNTFVGKLTNKAVAESLGLEYTPLS
jgi:alanine dehydrogenase